MRKICTGCHKEKDISSFSFGSKKTRRAKCKECISVYQRNYYHSTGEKDKQKKRVKDYEKMLRQKYREYKADKQCVFCDEASPECLDFHHKNPKDKDMEVTKLIRYGSWDRILSEMSKCIIVCSNCHRKIHSGRIKCDPVAEVVF